MIKKNSYHTGTAWCGTSVEILSTTEGWEIEWFQTAKVTFRSLKVTGIGAIQQAAG